MSVASQALFVLAMLQAGGVPLRSIDKGVMSEVSAARQVVVSDGEAWAALWHEHAPARPLPDVDFTREVVVGVFLGTRSSAGFSVEITGCREDGGHYVVQYRETSPSRGTIVAQVIVSPYHLVALPKHPGTITFEKLAS